MEISAGTGSTPKNAPKENIALSSNCPATVEEMARKNSPCLSLPIVMILALTSEPTVYAANDAMVILAVVLNIAENAA